MLRISNITYQNTALFLENAVSVAEYYGFTHVDNAPKCKTPSVSGRNKKLDASKIDFLRRDERALVPTVKLAGSRGLGDTRQPAFLWKQGPVIKQGDTAYTTLELHVLGIPTAISEALLLTIADAIADSSGVDRRVVCVNSMGTPDSSARYVRDLASYLRKNLAQFPSAIRARITGDPLGALSQLIERGDPIAHSAPSSMEYLNEEERRHFWNVLEYLESAALHYELTPHVIGSRDCWSHTLFDLCLVDAENETLVPFARGGRYDTLASNSVGAGASAVGITIMCEAHGRTEPKRRSKKKTPDLYFAHLGVEAKRRAIPVLEVLRQSDIAVHQSLAHNHIAEQMEEAKRLAVPFILVMGHKEATEGTVLVREMRTNSQEPVLLEALPGYLKRRRVASFA